MDVHIVVKGDTLWKIARQYGIPFEELKRVNAHLANPDYIVPGMKIFLPVRQEAKKPVKQDGVKEKTSPPKQSKEPQKPIPLPKKEVKEEVVRPQETSPPKQPTEAVKPTSKPLKQPVQPTMMPPTQPTQPTPMPIPIPAPAPPAAHYYYQHFYPIPCGWMPIFDIDVDCQQIAPPFWREQQQPQPHRQQETPKIAHPSIESPTYVSPKAESSMEKELDESTIYPGQGPGTAPTPYPIMREWKYDKPLEKESKESSMESPEQMHEKPTMSSPMPMQHGMPAHEMVHCPPEQGYVPQMMAPSMQMNEAGCSNWMTPPYQMPAYSQDGMMGLPYGNMMVHPQCGCTYPTMMQPMMQPCYQVPMMGTYPNYPNYSYYGQY